MLPEVPFGTFSDARWTVVLVPVMIGQMIIHDQITAKLGTGGRVEVNPATDTKPDRRVALKLSLESLREALKQGSNCGARRRR